MKLYVRNAPWRGIRHMLTYMITATICLKTIKGNIKRLKRQLLPNVKICAVVKADAYSLGDVRISRFLQPHVYSFAVSSICEAIRLRKGGITKPILMFGVCEDFESAVKHNLTISINHPREFKNLSKALAKMPDATVGVHIKINTGMNRYGLSSIWQLRNILADASANPQINIEGLYTHFAFETDNIREIDAQLKRFTPFRAMFARKCPHGIVHAACSGSAHYLPAQFDMVRIGKSFYGGFDGYKTAIEISSKIIGVQNAAPRQKIGYGGTATATQATVVGIVPCGYADCAHINLSSSATVLVGDTPCRILGRICMDCFLVDVSQVSKPLGKKVIIIGAYKGQSIMEIARATNTVACNLITSLNFQRCKVIYK